MDNIPNLEELLNYGEEYQYPDLIMSDYLGIDNSRKREDSKTQSQDLEQLDEKKSQEQSVEQSNEEQSQEQSVEQSNEEQSQEQSVEQSNEEQSQEQSVEQQNEEQSQDQSVEQQNEGQSQEQSVEQINKEQSQEQSVEQINKEQSQEQSVEQSGEQEVNDFDDLMNNYEEDYNREQQNNNKERHTASDKLNDITTTKIYKVLKKLVSFSYERYQKGTYKYDKKEIVKHYITNQKFKIIDDLVSPTFKPDVYVFDLSPSNNESLELYVNAISSVAIKNSLIYLTYNDCILRKLLIKKENAKNVDVAKIMNSEDTTYSYFDCTIFHEYRSLYEELKQIKNRKIYIFSDFDISLDISKLSLENQDIVWFSTEKSNFDSPLFQGVFHREFPNSYVGYYVETSGIEDIEKFIQEKNKSKYKRRSM